jgi:hypothetical protein
MISLDDLNAVTAGDTPFEFEYKFNNGKSSGVFLQVLGSESEKVAIETASIMAAERARKQATEATGKEYEFDAAKVGKELAAARIVGWRGIKEEYTPDNAKKLCFTNQMIADQVLQKSNSLENFIKL